MKLGRLPARYDPRTFRLASLYPVGQLPAPPSLRDWTGRESGGWQMYSNDRIGCCTIATVAHLTQAWTSMQGHEYEMPEDDVIAAYRAVSGYDGTPQTDLGANMLDAMNYVRQVGIGGRKIHSFVAVDPKNRWEMEIAINLFGGVAIGADLPMAAKSQHVWEVAPANEWTTDYRSGSWGGHAMACVGYNHRSVTLVTWGQVKIASWSWLLSYTAESYAILSEDWVSATRLAPNGFDLEALSRSLTALAA